MVASGGNTALHRKLARTREGANTGVSSALRALRLACARASRDMYGLALSVIGATQSMIGPDDVTAFMPEGRMLILLDGPGGQAGAVVLDVATVIALIQQQTMGTVGKMLPEERNFTETDAALAAPFIVECLKRASEISDIPLDQVCLRGYRFGAKASDPVSLSLALDAERFRIFELTVDIASGLHQGEIGLILPERALPPEPEPAPSVQARRALGPTVMQVQASLTAVLARLQVPLSQFSTLRVGDVLPIRADLIKHTELLSLTGQTLAVGRLGQIDGFRAIRLNEADEAEETSAPEFTQQADPMMAALPEEGAGFMADGPALDLDAMPDGLPNLDLPDAPAFDGLGSGLDAEGGLPVADAALLGQNDGAPDEALPDLSADQMAQEISQLAGLDSNAPEMEPAAMPMAMGEFGGLGEEDPA